MNRRQFLHGTGTATTAALTMSFSSNALANFVTAPVDSFPPLETLSVKPVTVDRSGRVISISPHEARYFREHLGASENLEMMAIQAGETMLGSTDNSCSVSAYESNPQCVDIAPFYLGRTSVTQNQWRAVAALPAVSRELIIEPSCFAGGDHPVECISWDDAQEFCDRLTISSGKKYRLPSEAEWEIACRAGTKSPFHVGKTITSQLANYSALQAYDGEKSGTYLRSTSRVGQFAPNAYGLYDMHGNVWEWCSDAWQDNYQKNSAQRVVSDVDRRALRGGSWADVPTKLRSASRTGYPAESLNRIIGFRIALSLEKV